MDILRNGIDLIETERFENMKPEIRERFLTRVFTEREREICRDIPQHLAGRFAAKEAVAKTLGTGIGKVSWQDIEILNDENGAPRLILHGEAARVAEEAGLTVWSVSITHIKTLAAATAAAMGGKGEHE